MALFRNGDVMRYTQILAQNPVIYDAFIAANSLLIMFPGAGGGHSQGSGNCPLGGAAVHGFVAV